MQLRDVHPTDRRHPRGFNGFENAAPQGKANAVADVVNAPPQRHQPNQHAHPADCGGGIVREKSLEQRNQRHDCPGLHRRGHDTQREK